MKSSADEIDGVMRQWATQARRLLQLDDTAKLAADAALTLLQASSAALASMPASRLTGAAAAVQGALRAMPVERRQLVALHYLHSAIPSRLTARFADLSPTAYYAALDTAKSFVRGYFRRRRIPHTHHHHGATHMKTIRVLRPFILSMRDAEGHLTDIPFRPGEQAVDDAVADHPFIRAHFADGCIERPGAPPPPPPSAHAVMTREPQMFAIMAYQRGLGHK